MKIAIGCDEAAYELKELLRTFISDLGHEVKDFGTFDAAPVLYPDIGHDVATAVASSLISANAQTDNRQQTDRHIGMIR